MKKLIKLTLIIFLFTYSITFAQNKCSIPPNEVIPSQNQIQYQQMEIIGFIHFTITTFYNREWGLGDENPQRFNPIQLNVEQWVKTAKAGGLKELILTTKHHDGFCLWPSKYTEHSIKNSPYKNGKGDIVREFTDACRKYGIKVGLYLSPWDRNHKDYGRPEYIDYFKNQLVELLIKYGPINEIWFDGANGGEGYYGGANEKRIIDENYYPWFYFHRLVKRLQPNCLIFSDAGPDIRWVGNEKGHCGETFWSTIDSSKLSVGMSNTSYLNTGEPDGNTWLVGQCDVSIRPGWFFHAKENNKVKSPEELVDIYYKSVGRNGLMLINLPPDSTGRLHKTDSLNLLSFKSIIDETFKRNLAKKAKVSASSVWSGKRCYRPDNIVDKKVESFWAAKEGSRSAQLEIIFKKPVTFNRILLQEPIKYGQRISEFEILIFANNEWKKLIYATTIGHKRLLQCEKVTTSKIKVNIIKANSTPAISNFGVYLASERE